MPLVLFVMQVARRAVLAMERVLQVWGSEPTESITMTP